jgi:hypothetical protein
MGTYLKLVVRSLSQVFMRERLERVSIPDALQVIPEAETVEQGLSDKAAALRAGNRWTPSDTDVQSGRAV